jgi:hypothetical protein
MSDRDDHRPEPEIIPPGADATRWQDRNDPRQGSGGQGQGRQNRMWIWSNDPRYARLRPGRPGPLGLVIIVAALAALGALGFFVFLGALAIALPVIAVILIVGLLGGILRRL